MKGGMKVRKEPLALWALTIVIATAFLLLLSGEMREATGWEGTFEDNIEVIYTPMNPLDGQSVNVTIRSRGTIISAANLNVELFYPGGERTTGGYQFKRINTTSMYVIIPGYPGELRCASPSLYGTMRLPLYPPPSTAMWCRRWGVGWGATSMKT